MRQPNGWFVNDMIVFGDLDTRGYIAKGFKRILLFNFEPS